MAFINMLMIFTIQAFVPQSTLPQLITKQSIENLRFVSADGKFTYYQNQKGELLYSTNYSVEKVMQGIESTHYEIFGSKSKKQLIMTMDEFYHSSYAGLKEKKIYLMPWGKSAHKYIANGVNPRLHLNDAWLSYYTPATKEINFVNTSNPVLRYSLKIVNSRDPYYLPQVIMLDESRILYTDKNKKGVTGLLLFSRIDKKPIPVYKPKHPNFHLEICRNDEYLYLGEFPINKERGLSKIRISKLNTFKDVKSFKTIYQSTNSDLGNFICDMEENKLYFIASTYKESNKETTEAAVLDAKDHKLKVLSDVEYATSLINMDGKLLLPFRGRFFLLKGKNDLFTIDRLNQSKDNNFKQEKK